MRQKTFLIGPYCPIAPLLRILSLFSVLTGKKKRHDLIRGHALNLCRCPSHIQPEAARQYQTNKQRFFFIIANYDNYTDLPSPPSCPSMETLPSSLQEPKWV